MLHRSGLTPSDEIFHLNIIILQRILSVLQKYKGTPTSLVLSRWLVRRAVSAVVVGPALVITVYLAVWDR